MRPFLMQPIHMPRVFSQIGQRSLIMPIVAAAAIAGCGVDTTKPSDTLLVPGLGQEAIAFASDRNGDFDLYLARPGGGNIRRITNDRGFDAEPAWAPDGTQLAFVSERSHDSELYVLDLADLATRRLTKDPGQSAAPSWSPDGASIAYVSDSEGSSDIFIIPAAGGDRRRLTQAPGAELQPAWSIDGQRILYTSDQSGNLDIYEVNAADASSPRQLVSSPAADGHGSWSPDGLWLAFVSDRNGNSDVFRVPAADLQATPVSVTYREASEGFRPSWSADSRQLAYVSNTGGNPDVYVIQVSARQVAPLPPAPSLRWSPDGTRAAVLPSGGGLLSVVDTLGLTVRELSDAVVGPGSPAWSPSGRRLAFVSEQDGAGEVNVAVMSTGQVLNVSSAGAIDNEPAWSPGGNRLAFVSDRAGSSDIFIARLGVDAVGSLRVDSLSNASPNAARDWAPNWALAGDRIAFLSDRSGASAAYIAALGANGMNLPATPAVGPIAAERMLSWSPGGGRLALAVPELVVVTAEGTVLHQGTAPVLGEVVWGGNDQLAYVSDVTGDREVYLLTLSAAGGQVRNLSQHPGADDAPTWSFQREAVAFSSDRDGAGDVYAIRIASGGVFRLTSAARPVHSLRWWLRTETLFFVGESDGVSALFKRTAPRRLTANSGRDWFPAWSP